MKTALWKCAVLCGAFALAAPAELVAEHEALRVENPAGEQIRVASRSRLRANRAGVGVWQAQLVDRAFDDPLGRQRPVTVRGIRVDGRAAEFLHDDGELVVALGRSLALGDAVEVEVALEGQLAQHRPPAHLPQAQPLRLGHDGRPGRHPRRAHRRRLAALVRALRLRHGDAGAPAERVSPADGRPARHVVTPGA